MPSYSDIKVLFLWHMNKARKIKAATQHLGKERAYPVVAATVEGYFHQPVK